MELIERALAQGQPALSEHDAKRFLAGVGIPVCREVLAPDPDAAAAEAGRLGFPVVLKACGAALSHKTEVGGVAIDLRTVPEVRDAGRRLLTIPGCEALLVQELVRGQRELVCGLTRDPALGPCVMFGLGGILTELLDDAVFRVAPLTAADAGEMLGEIRGAAALGPFRGEAPADRTALARILVALGDVGLRFPAIRGIDLNPLKLRPDGTPVAVDALVSLVSAAPAGR